MLAATPDKGSSVSTAITVGLASLTLSSSLYAGNERAGDPQRRRRLVEERFERMSRAGDDADDQVFATVRDASHDVYVQIDRFLRTAKLSANPTVNDTFMTEEFATDARSNTMR